MLRFDFVYSPIYRAVKTPVVQVAAALLLLVLGMFPYLWGVLCFAGGPEAQFLSSGPLRFGAGCTAVALVVFLFALRLLSVPMKWAALFLIPAVLAVAGAAIEGVLLIFFAVGVAPFLCLAVIVVIWVRSEW